MGRRGRGKKPRTDKKIRHGMQAGPVRDIDPAWDPSVPRGQKPAVARRKSRTGPVRCDIRDPCGNRLDVFLAGYQINR